MIAQSMMTKLNRSEYVTIACPPSARSRNGWQEPSTSSLIKYILLSLSGSDILGYRMGRRDLGSHSGQINAGNISPVYIIPNSGDGSILRCPLIQNRAVSSSFPFLIDEEWERRRFFGSYKGTSENLLGLKTFREIHDLPCYSKTEKCGFVDERTFCLVVLYSSSKKGIVNFTPCRIQFWTRLPACLRSGLAKFNLGRRAEKSALLTLYRFPQILGESTTQARLGVG